MRNFTQFIRSEEETRLDIFCRNLKTGESGDLAEILKGLGFTFCYVVSDSILAFLNGEYSQVKDVLKRLEKDYGFKWTGRPAILGVTKEELEGGERNSGSKLKVENKKQDFSSGFPEYTCQNCKKSFFGWAEANICPDCDGKLILVEKS